MDILPKVQRKSKSNELTKAAVFKTKKAPQKISAPASASKDPAPAPGYVRRC